MTEGPIDKALIYLSRRAYPERRLAEKLSKDGFTEAEIGECLLRLKSWGYLNDRRFGSDRIRQLQERLKSRSYVMADLENSGLDKELIAELLESFYPEELELEIAGKLIAKKYLPIKSSQPKGWVSLIRAGFSENTVRHCFPDIDPT
ncbi:MAG: regulatory protein RecX [Bacillota bacterium]